MPKKIAIIPLIAIVAIALGATAVYITQKQVGKEVRREEGVATVPQAPEKPPVQPPETPPITEVTPQPEAPTTTEPIDTSNWKVYRDEELRIVFRYPDEWQFPLPKMITRAKEFTYAGEFYLPIRVVLYDRDSEFLKSVSTLNDFCEWRKINTPNSQLCCGMSFEEEGYKRGFRECKLTEISTGQKGVIMDVAHCFEGYERSCPEPDYRGGALYTTECLYSRIFFIFLNNKQFPLLGIRLDWGEDCFEKRYCSGVDVEKSLRYQACKERNAILLEKFNALIKEIQIF
jgi:hypothetical protein